MNLLKYLEMERNFNMTPTETKKNKNEVLEALRIGLCKLIYEKLNGDIRIAEGTLHVDFIPTDCLPKSNDLNKSTNLGPTDLVTYFDTGVCGWRTFYVDHLQHLHIMVHGN